MENPKEILWEFTLKCNKNCCYCGSKDILKKELEEHEKNGYETIGQIGIAMYITEVHPDEVTITGGEPSCEYEELVKSVEILYKAGIKVKILTNGNLFAKMAGDYEIGATALSCGVPGFEKDCVTPCSRRCIRKAYAEYCIP